MFYYKRFFSTNITVRGELSDVQKQTLRALADTPYQQLFNEMGRIFEKVEFTEVAACLDSIRKFCEDGTPCSIRFADGAIGLATSLDAAKTAFLDGSE